MNKSFTLIEILVVIVVIGILSSFILIGMSSITQSANIAKSKTFSDSLRNSLLNNIVSEWKLDGNTNDSWGDNNGTWSGPAGAYTSPSWRTSSECVSNGCLAFDGTDDYISVAHNANLNLTNSMTISFWSKGLFSGGTSGGLINKGNSGFAINVNYYIFSNSSTMRFFIGNGVSSNSATSVILLDNQWYYFVFVLDTSELISYTNSIKKTPTTSRTINPVANNETFKIGVLTDSPGNPFNGLIDDVRIYNAAIPTSQIEQNYFLGLNKLYKNRGLSKIEYRQRLSELKSNLAAHE
ncbi:MAG TPA: LamG domain-containing protein [Candidatus Pacearchaeota archaeon]|nr:LamG domain-containing protein [Candidatus Pacearchaeota archaeon]HQM24304.1 LamG domain-containing protein [Candidatus Pacearchaeota archaeon]